MAEDPQEKFYREQNEQAEAKKKAAKFLVPYCGVFVLGFVALVVTCTAVVV